MLELLNSFFGIVGGVVTVVGFILGIKDPDKRTTHALYMLLVAGGVAVATYQYSLNQRVNSVARAADKLYEDREMKYTHRGFTFAALAFLEKNKDLYPDTYSRAQDLCKKFKCNDPSASTDMVDLAFTMSGLVRGLGTLSGK